MSRVRALAFSGCGFNGAYHLGAIGALAKKVDFDKVEFTGASAGAIAATNAAVWADQNEEGVLNLIHGIRLVAK